MTEELNIILDSSRIPMCVLNVILDDRTLHNLSVGDILEKYEFFTKRQLVVIQKYIHSHIDNKDPLFVSDLIDCANMNNIESDTIFGFCLDTIKKRRSSSSVLSSIIYVFEHMKITQSPVVIPVLERVINNNTYYQDCQIVAAFCLFRITMNPTYLQSVREFASMNEDLHKVLNNKMLLMDYNRNRSCFFYVNDILKNVDEK